MMADKFKPGDLARVVGCYYPANAFLIGQEVVIEHKEETKEGVGYYVRFLNIFMKPKFGRNCFLQQHLEPVLKPPTAQDIHDAKDLPDFNLEAPYEYVKQTEKK
jgi:hypothetical protein